MTPLDLEHMEAQFGLMIREKENHDNYALLRFEDLDKVINYYNSFKDEFNSKLNGEKNKEDKRKHSLGSWDHKIQMNNKTLNEINEKILSVLTRLETVKQIQDKGDGDDNLET
ncbi:MAG: hypothetical protein HN756_02085 [Nitrosopumilus sp.]|jgi:hypothetical protein|nr:hypothetical protein [Nitrosopumilus sp.]